MANSGQSPIVLNSKISPQQPPIQPQRLSGSKTPRSSGEQTQTVPNFTARKLIVDPALTKGAFKVYRYDGRIPGQSPMSYHNILVRDPRSKPKPQNLPLILPVPEFIVDKNYVGPLPRTEVTFTNLNDNVGEVFLRALCQKFGVVVAVQILVHPISHRHLGVGHVDFKTSREAKACVQKLNGTLVMGRKVNVFYDASGKKFQELFLEFTTQKPKGTTSANSNRDINDGRKPIARTSSDQFGTNGSSAVEPAPPPPLSRSLACTPSSSKTNHSRDFGISHTPSYESESTVSTTFDDRMSSQTNSTSKTRKRDKERYIDDDSNWSFDKYINPPQHGSTSRCLPHPPLPLQQQNTVSPPQQINSIRQPQNLISGNDFEECELSPKIDLDTRIRHMLQGGNSSKFGKFFVDGNISPMSNSESDANASPPKRTRFSIGSSSTKLWDSESDEEVNKEASFARKFKQSFVPVRDGAPSAAHNMSPPPSPFLTFTTSSGNQNAAGKADSQFDQISDDDDGQVGGNANDDMSLSSLSPDAAAGSRIRQSRFSAAPPLPTGQVQHSGYYGEYYYNNNAYSANYQAQAWGSHHHPKDQQYYHHPHHLPEYQGKYEPEPGYSGSYDRHYHPGSSYHPPSSTHSDRPDEARVQPPKPPIPPSPQDHENPELLINATIEVMVDDLKKVLWRDCNKRLIESEAFKMYEDWWDHQTKELKRKQDEENAKNQIASAPAASEVIIDNDHAGNAAVAVAGCSAEALGTGLGVGPGLLNAIPKLPSFRRNIKAPSPVQDADSRNSFFDSDSNSDSMTKEEPKTEIVPESSLIGDYQNPFLVDNETPLIIPDDVPRSKRKKSSKAQAFRQRQEHGKLELVYEFLKEGIDAEDIGYLKKAYENLQNDDTTYSLKLKCTHTHWVDHPETVIEKKKQKSKSKNEFEEGSLRTRGFVRMTKDEKSRAMAGQELASMSFDGTLPGNKGMAADLGKARETQIREARSNQRRLLTVLGTESDLLKFNQLHFRKKALKFARSDIHEWGLFAAEPIAAEEMVIEYVGQMIRSVLADLRETKYQAQGIRSSYLFKVDSETIIDATKCGNLSRFINHSCNPNCYAKVITIEGQTKIVIYSKQPIAVSEEITYDYKFPKEDKKIPCLCGTEQCRGTLN